MCLFPWLDYGIDIVDFENFDFLVGQPNFTSVRAGPAGQNGLFRNNEVTVGGGEIKGKMGSIVGGKRFLRFFKNGQFTKMCNSGGKT